MRREYREKEVTETWRKKEPRPHPKTSSSIATTHILLLKEKN
jgi:hypothetical protein